VGAAAAGADADGAASALNQDGDVGIVNEWWSGVDNERGLSSS